jgi:OOP family OmpA-OmpF porin
MRALTTSALGLAALALLYAVAMPRLAERIPETLRETAEARLQAEAMAWVQVRADGRDLLLEGAAPSPEDQRRAVELAAGVPGVRHLVDGIRLRAVSPYRLSIDWQDGRLALAGYMPDQASLDALVAQIGPRTGEDAPNLAVAAGAPAGWAAFAVALVDAITRLDQAEAKLVDQKLSLRGTTTSVDTRDGVLGALAGYEEQGFALAPDITATVSPYTMTLTKRDGVLEAWGFVPDAASRGRLAEQLAGAGARAQAEVREAAGAPPGWSDLVIAIVDELPRFVEASARLADRELRLVGTMYATADRDRFLSELRAFEQQGYDLDPQVEAADEAAVRCQARLDQLLLTPIFFASGEARIDTRSDALLEAVAETAMTCPHARIRIAGHTDDRGRPEDNLLLSRERAEAVAARLAAAGVEDSRITAVGHGAEQPIADNGTAEGRAKNRRIEFVVEVDR